MKFLFTAIKDIFNIGGAITGLSWITLPMKIFGYVTSNWKAIIILIFLGFIWWKYHGLTSEITHLNQVNTQQAVLIQKYKTALDTQNQQISFWAAKSTEQNKKMKTLEQQIQQQQILDQQNINSLLLNVQKPLTCQQAMDDLLTNAPQLGKW